MSSLTPASIYCMSKDCLPSSDWLTHMPSSAAGWAMGGVILAMSIIRISWTTSSSMKVSFLINHLGLLVVSLFLRAAMNLERGNKVAMYKASLFFNYYTAISLGAELVIPIFKIIRQKRRTYRSCTCNLSINMSTIHCLLSILMIPAVVIMFNTANSNSVDPSVYIIRTVVFCVMILAFVSFINALAFMFKANNPHTYATFAIMLQNLLLTLWASFMASRTFLPLDNPARDSESMFYWLNIAPLFIIGIIPSCTPMEPDNSSQVAA